MFDFASNAAAQRELLSFLKRFRLLTSMTAAAVDRKAVPEGRQFVFTFSSQATKRPGYL
jgi:hypothetical protein